jgi:glyoxylase-like metal-dependent hydrolase (beta-lactamase superfamily II)
VQTSKAFGLAWCVLLAGQLAAAQAPPQGGAPPEVKVVATRLGGDVYGIDGQGGRMAALVGPEGVFLVDSQFPAVTEKIVAALKGLSTAPLRLLVNTHAHGDHSGGNENFAKLGVTILGRPNLRNELLKPRPAPGNGQVPPVAPPGALPIVLYDAPTTVYLNGETVRLIPLAPAHTDGDTAVKFEQADVLMTGDVFRSAGFPPRR